jgi:hypothetical protein
MVPTGIITHLIIDGTGPEILQTFGIYILPICGIVAATSWLGAQVAIKMLPQRVLTYPFIIAVAASLIKYLMNIKEMLGY